MSKKCKDSYNCEKCKDLEYIIDKETNTGIPCECREKNIYKRILEKSGIADSFRKIGFKEYKIKNKECNEAKNASIEYTKMFETIEKERNNSICFIGNVGTGKTHLSISIANNLMYRNIGVLYMPYREVITKIKQNMLDELEYNKTINKYKNARVLLIDDLFKGKITESDLNIMFDIINHRYLNRMPLIVSSEFNQNKLLDFDEAVGSRIIEMCKNYIIEFKETKNYRVKTN